MKTHTLILLFFGLGLSSTHAQRSIATVDFIKIINNHRQEALFFYEKNWKIYRDIALEKDYIKSYKLMTVLPDTISNNFDLVLITEYSDSIQFKLNEQHFQAIIKKTRPSGPKLLNDLKPNDFRQLLFYKQTEVLFNGEKQKNNNKQ